MTLRLNGETRLYGIVGDPIAQTLSPQGVTPLLAAEGLNAVLVPLHVPAGRLAAVMAGLRVLNNFHGTMVTYPFKADALALLDEARPTARLVGAVNAIRREPDGRWIGDIFDGHGLVAGLAGEGIVVAGKRVLLLGAGGAGSAIALALAETGAAAIGLFDIDAARVEKLRTTVAGVAPACVVATAGPDPTGYDILVNATPMGMTPADPSPVEPAKLARSLIVMDIVPRADAPLVGAARAAGCRTIDYVAMARGQYVAIARFFAGRD